MSAVEHDSATYAAFLNHAFDRQRGRFRNFMSFDRHWLEEVGSEDCQGHALWALGLCVAQAGHSSFQMLAAQLFEQALPAATEFTSPRAWAFTLIGIDEYLRRLSGDRRPFRDILSLNPPGTGNTPKSLAATPHAVPASAWTATGPSRPTAAA